MSIQKTVKHGWEKLKFYRDGNNVTWLLHIRRMNMIKMIYELKVMPVVM